MHLESVLSSVDCDTPGNSVYLEALVGTNCCVSCCCNQGVTNLEDLQRSFRSYYKSNDAQLYRLLH